MKRLLPLCLCFLLLCGCARKTPAAEPETPLPPLQPQESKVITYQLDTDILERDAFADDGTLLVQFYFQRPVLNVLVDGEPMDAPSSAPQREAQAKADTFAEAFEHWTSEESMADTIAMAKEQYGYSPESFQVTGMNYAEEFSYESRQMGNILSISGIYYSYLGGAHPNTAFSSWNFDLESGKFIRLPELAEDPEAFTLAVADMLEAQATQWCHDPAFGGSPEFTLADFYWSDYRDVMEHWADSSSVFLGDDGVEIIFSAYDLASYAAGPQMFQIPYADLDSYWSDAGRAVLGLNG